MRAGFGVSRNLKIASLAIAQLYEISEEPDSTGGGILLIRRQSSIDVWENSKDLIKLRNLENCPYVLAKTSYGKFAAVGLDILHGFDQYSQPGAIDVTNASQIDNQPLWSFPDNRAERFRDVWRNVQIDFAIQRQNIGSIFTRHRAGSF